MSFEYYVSDIKEVNKKKRLVFINEEPAFELYVGELRKYQITKDSVISQDLYGEIVKEVLCKRAKLRCMHLLKSRDMTEHELRKKLESSYYPAYSIDIAIEYVKGYGYVDDYRYAENYIQFKGEQKSKLQVIIFLKQKGIEKDIIEAVSRTYYEDNGRAELDQIERLIQKKKIDVLHMNQEQKYKLLSYLTRRGYKYETITKSIEVIIDKMHNLE